MSRPLSPFYEPGLFTEPGYQIETYAWHDILRDSASSCKLTRVEFCKTRGNKLHEFLILYFSHPARAAARAVAVVDRAATNRPPFFVIISPSVRVASQTTTKALDRVHVIGQGEILENYLSRTYDQYEKLCILNYPESNSSSLTPPSAIQLSTLLLVVSNHQPNYDLYEYNCYWYATTIFEACKRLFPGCQEECNKHGDRGRCRLNLTVYATHSLPHVCDKYDAEWKKVLQRWVNQEIIGQEGLERRLEEERRVREGLERELEEMKRRCKQLEGGRPASLHCL